MKLDLTGMHSARNEADRRIIQNSEHFNQMTDAVRKNIKNKGAQAVSDSTHSLEENNKAVEEIVTNLSGITGQYARIPRNRLVSTPKEWNRFTPTTPEKKVLMADSIYRNGLQQPIVVRALDPDNNQFQILAGNTRNEIYEVLYAATHDPKYLEIDARVYQYNEINDAVASEIVSDTNYIQRANLSAKDRAFCIHNKWKAIRNGYHNRGDGDILTAVANEMNLGSRTTAFYWNKIAKLIPEFADYFDNGNIDLVSASKIAGFDKDTQEALWANRDILTNEVLHKLHSRSKNPLNEINNIIDSMSKPIEPIASGHMSVDYSSITIKADRPPEAGTTPVLLYLPDDVLDKLKKKYEQYIVSID